MIHVRFDDALRKTDAHHFISHVLVSLGVRHLFAGLDFAFGKGRGGDFETINKVGRNIGMKRLACPAQCVKLGYSRQ